jgi:hypothetical protein
MKKLLLLLLLPISVLGQMTYTQTLTTYSYESTSGTSLTLGDDQTIPNLPIGFTFNYWGTNYTSVNICSNGWISFTNTGGNIVGGSPNNVVGNGIHANAMDLFPISNYFVRYQTIGSSPSRKFVVSYHIGYYSCNSNNSLFTDFQIVLSETTNLIQINVNSHPGCASGASLQGVSNQNNSLIVTTPGRNGVNWSPTTNSSVIFTPYIPFSHSGFIRTENNVPVPNITTKLFKREQTLGLSNTMDVKVYSTHAGNGNTSQYGQYPTTTSEFDRIFNTSFSNTQLRWSGTLPTTTCLNFTTFTTLRNAGATIPNNGDFYSVEVTGTFIPAVTGQYSFGINSDDGSDLFIGGVFVVSYYGGHGMSGPIYGTINLVAGTQYTFRARMQEYTGGDGLSVVWRRPGQSTHSLQGSEIGVLTPTFTPWTQQTTSTTNSLGQYSFSQPTNQSDEWSIEIVIPTVSSNLTQNDFLGIDSVLLERIPTRSIHFHKYDLNGDTRISVGDIVTVARRINGLSYQKRTLLFTENQWMDLLLGTTDLRLSVPGFINSYTFTPLSGGTSNFYLLSPGYTNQQNLTY